MLDYGYRSGCCGAAIRIGSKKVKNTSLTKKVWICCRCKKKDIQLVQYNADGSSGSTQTNRGRAKFVDDSGEQSTVDNENSDDSTNFGT